MNTTPDPIKAIKRAVLTEIRAERDDVHVDASPKHRGGFTLKTDSHLDILLEAKVIQDNHYRMGLLYWRLRDHLTQCVNPLFSEIESEEATEQPVTIEENTIEDPETFMVILMRQMAERYRKAVDAACQAAGGPKYIIIQAFGENTIKQAFDALDDGVTKTYEELERRKKEEERKKRLQASVTSVDSGAVSYV